MKTITLDFSIGRQLIVNGSLWVIESLDGPSAVNLCALTSGQVVRFTRNELARLAIDGKLSDPAQPATGIVPPSRIDISALPESKRALAMRRLQYVNAVKRMYPIGPQNPHFVERISETAAARNDPSPPSPHSVYRWLRRFVTGGYDTAVFLRDVGTTRKRKPRLQDGVHERLEELLLEALGNTKGGSLHGVADDVLATLAREFGYDRFKSVTGAEMYISELEEAATWLFSEEAET